MQTVRSVVLVVEDDPLILLHARMALEDAGYEVLATSDGEAALAEVARRDDIAALLTDIDLPGSAIDGVALAAEMRRGDPAMTIVVTSGKHAPDADDLPERGRFIAKPYTIAEVRQALDIQKTPAKPSS